MGRVKQVNFSTLVFIALCVNMVLKFKEINSLVLKKGTLMNTEYLKKHIGAIEPVDPPYYWKKTNLTVVGDSYLDFPYPEEYAWLRVHVVQEDIEPMIECNAFILSTKDAKELDWLKGTRT